MTLCVVWRDHQTIHMASDSRVTLRENSTADVAIKVMRIPCRIYAPSMKDGPPLIEHQFDVAMLFAGSHITSAVMKESLEEVLANLQLVPGSSDVSVGKIAQLCFRAYRQISRKVCETAIGKYGIAEIVLAGRCPVSNKLRAFSLTTDEKTNEHSLEEVLTQELGHKVYGRGATLARKFISDGVLPLTALQNVIDSEEEASVGGAIQYGRFEDGEFVIRAIPCILNNKVVYPRGALDLNELSSLEGDDLFIRIRTLQGPQ